jgi:hypothetical protein
MEHTHKVDVPLAHRVDVNEATQYLVHKLNCDSWYVACHHDHLFVFHLMKGTTKKYALRFECTSPVEKGIYHSSKAWSLSIIPLDGQENLSENLVNEIRDGLEASVR